MVGKLIPYSISSLEDISFRTVVVKSCLQRIGRVGVLVSRGERAQGNARVLSFSQDHLPCSLAKLGAVSLNFPVQAQQTRDELPVAV